MNKLLITIVFVFSLLNVWAVSLPVAIDMNRFLDDKQRTKFEINYKVKYRDLSFVEINKAYFADLKVKIEILKGDSILTKKEFTNRIGVSSQNDALSEQKSYLDKISLVLSGQSYKMRVYFTDVKTGNLRIWNQELVELPAEITISDLELSNSITPADTTRFMEKFRRNGQIHMVEPSHVFFPVSQDSMYVYFQLYGSADTTDESDTFKIEYRLIKETKIIKSWQVQKNAAYSTTSIQTGISLKELPLGLYDLEVVVKSGSISEKAKTFFVLGEIKEDLIAIFPRIEDEIKLLRYFVPNTKLTPLESLTNDGKKRMINQLWTTIATENKMTVQQWVTQIKDRISYANRFYSHFKPGWESDRGRIYIRMGIPDDIKKESTSDTSKFVQKDYQIWKYATNDRIYIFIDIQMNGNFKMIYTKNDDNESSAADWKRYLGNDFNEDDLEKDSQYPSE